MSVPQQRVLNNSSEHIELSSKGHLQFLPFQNVLFERLADMTISPQKPQLCWHPDTDPEVIEKFHKHNSDILDTGLHPGGGNKYELSGRWSSTATNGGGLTQGDPTTLTWSFVPDGTEISQGCGVNGESNDDSDFIDFFDGQFGAGPGGTDLTQRPWFVHFEVVFDRWEELTGITYIYEPNDDGAIYGGNASLPGVVGVRGDIRIGGHRLDGNSNVLACNYLPNSGDMIFDTDDNTYNSGNILGVRNIISHEHGHGLGLLHSCPITQSKLMEPFLTSAFDGPQEDDILAVNRQYGDPNENNNSTATAKSLGTVTAAIPLFENMVSIDDNSENDYYSFTCTSTDDYTIRIIPTGSTYLAGPQLANGNCSAGTNFDALTESNLGVELIDTDGSTVIATVNFQPAGVNEELCNSQLSAGTYFVRVFGTANTAQMYDIEIEQGNNGSCVICEPIINEIDYDQGGTDDAEFIEIYNPCGQTIDLSTYSLQLINGANGNTYETINLTGSLSPGAYFVICTNAASTANCDLDVTINVDYIQDGAPDAIALFNDGTITDVVSYEGNVAGFVEGSGAGLEDDGSLTSFGISRIPNGFDSDMNNADFIQAFSTPGAPNIDSGIPLTNPTACQLNLPFPDGSCTSDNEFTISVTGVAGSQLGADVELISVDLIIEHTWTADLDISLIAPNGTSVLLSSDNGGNGDDYGDPADPSCQAVTSFDMTATTNISNANAPFVGSFIPEGDLSDFNGSNPNGLWILQICDDAFQDTGDLEFFRLNFEVMSCIKFYAGDSMLTGTQSSPEHFETDGIIVSNQTIDADVIYDSGSSIELLEGFEVFVGRVFDAFIDGCGNLLNENSETEIKE